MSDQKGERVMLSIIKDEYSEKGMYLDEKQINLIVDEVIETIKRGLPEEAQTVEVMEYIADQIKETLKGKRIAL